MYISYPNPPSLTASAVRRSPEMYKKRSPVLKITLGAERLPIGNNVE